MTVLSRAPYQSSPDLGFGPSYARGNWYMMIEGAPNAGVVMNATTVRLHPFRIRALCDIVALGTRITTLAVAGNIQLAVYRSNGNTLQPIGRPIANTGNIATDTAVNVNGVIVQGRAQLVPGIYWFGITADNATVVCQIFVNDNGGFLVGAATQDLLNSAATNATAFRSAASGGFGSFPDLTDPAAITSSLGSAWAAGQFQVAP